MAATQHDPVTSTLAAAGVRPAASAHGAASDAPSAATTDPTANTSTVADTLATDPDLGSADVAADPLDEPADGDTDVKDSTPKASADIAHSSESTAEASAAAQPVAELPQEFAASGSPAGGVFAAFTPSIPRVTSTATAADGVGASAMHAGPVGGTGLGELVSRLVGWRPRRHTVVALSALALLIVAAVIGGSPTSRPPTAGAGRPATAGLRPRPTAGSYRARLRVARAVHRGARADLRDHSRHRPVVSRPRVVVRHDAEPATPTPPVSAVPVTGARWRAASPAPASEFRP